MLDKHEAEVYFLRNSYIAMPYYAGIRYLMQVDIDVWNESLNDEISQLFPANTLLDGVFHSLSDIDESVYTLPYRVIDILRYGDNDLWNMSFRSRLSYLEPLSRVNGFTHVSLAPVYRGEDQKRRAFRKCKAPDYSGLIFKDLESTYTFVPDETCARVLSYETE